MKKTLLQICLSAGLTVMAAIVSAEGQTQYRVNIPFDFQIGQKTYQAGEYRVELLSQTSDARIIVIRDAKGRHSYSLRSAVTGQKTASAIFVFNRYADRFFLSEINTPIFNAQLSKSNSEEKLARAGKSNKETIAAVLAKSN